MANANLNVLISLKSRLDGFDSSEAGLKRLALGIGGAAAAYATFAAKEALALGAQITDLAARANIGTQAFQTLAAVGRDSGIQMEELAQSLVVMQKSIQDAAPHAKEFVNSFHALGLNAAALKALAPEQQLEVIARAVLKAKDPAVAFNAALDILGSKHAPKLRQLLESLAKDGFEKLADATAKLRISDEQLKSLDDAGDKLDRLWYRLKVIGAQGTIKLYDMVTAGGSTDEKDPLIAARKLHDYQVKLLGENHPTTLNFNKELQRLEEADKYSKSFVSTAGGDAEHQAQLAARRRTNLAGTSVNPEAPSTGAQAAYEEAKKKAEALQLQEDKLEASVDAFFSSIQRGSKVFEENLTATEVYNRAVATLDRLQEDGSITAETYARALEKAKQPLDELARAQADSALGRGIADLQAKRAIVENSRLLSVAQKERAIQPLLVEENRLIAERIRQLEREITLVQDPATRQALQGRVDTLHKQEADNTGAQAANAPLGFKDQMTSDLAGLENQFGTTTEAISGFLTNGIGTAVSSISQGIYGLATRTATWGQVGLQAGAQILQSLIGIGVQQAALYLVGKVLGDKAAQDQTKRGVQVAASNAPAAAAVSISSYGAAAVIGTIAAVIGIGAIIALLSRGFAEGGPVYGAGTGTSDSIAARLSNGEYVVPASAVSRGNNYAMLEAMRFNRPLPGMAGGGPVGDPIAAPSQSASGGAGGSRVLKFGYFDDRSAMRSWFESAEGEAVVLNHLDKNRHIFA